MYLRQGLEDGGSHKRIINSNDENTAGILKFGVIDISWNMRVTAPRAYREISSRHTWIGRTQVRSSGVETFTGSRTESSRDTNYQSLVFDLILKVHLVAGRLLDELYAWYCV